MIRKEVRRQIGEETNLSQYGIKRLRGGLTIETIKIDYPWILKANIQDAVLGIDECGLVWYSGTWKDGNWERGTWKYGTWWNGLWEDGTWKDGNWERGTWKYGTWKNGLWWNGLWEDGTWNSSKPHPNKIINY